jgi:hypothetical protein
MLSFEAFIAKMIFELAARINCSYFLAILELITRF